MYRPTHYTSLEEYYASFTNDSHSKYSPSKLSRLILCPGSINLHEDQESNIYANEGSACHEIVADHIEDNMLEFKPEHGLYQLFPDDLKVKYTQPIKDCLDYANELLTKRDRSQVLVETRVSLIGFKDAYDFIPLEEVVGTSDLLIRSPEDGIVDVVDWKFGVNEVLPTSAQLKAYGLAALKNIFLASKYSEVHLHIGQPRLYTGKYFKEHVYTPDDLIRWLTYTLSPALQQCESKNPPLNPSEEACQWCSAKNTCEARYSMAQQTAMQVFAEHAKLPNVIDIDNLAEFLTRFRELSSYIKDLEKHIAQTLMGGTPIKGLKMVHGRSSRNWIDEKAVINWVLTNAPDAEPFNTTLKSPNQMEQELGRKLAKTEEFQALIRKSEGKHTLVLEDDPREAIEYKSAEELFADFVEKDDE